MSDILIDSEIFTAEQIANIEKMKNAKYVCETCIKTRGGWQSDNADYEHNARPRVGVAMRVGTFGSRMMGTQDWWQTTLIEEILEDTPDYVKFRTKSGSIYEWRT